MDVEFVLGSSPLEDQQIRRDIPLDNILAEPHPTSTFEYVTNSNPDFSKRVTSLWLLDFDACSDITLDKVGVKAAVKAFLENEPYFPRPTEMGGTSNQLWNDFGNRYLETSRRILYAQDHGLPVDFLRGVSSGLTSYHTPTISSASAAHVSRSGSGQHRYSRVASREGLSGSSRSEMYTSTQAPQAIREPQVASKRGSGPRGVGRGRGSERRMDSPWRGGS